MGLILAVIGVYGMVSYATMRRTQEIGIRMALGANQRQVLQLIIRQGMQISLTGVFVGLLAAWGLTRMMTHMLVGISASDPVLYVEVAILFLSSRYWLATFPRGAPPGSIPWRRCGTNKYLSKPEEK